MPLHRYPKLKKHIALKGHVCEIPANNNYRLTTWNATQDITAAYYTLLTQCDGSASAEALVQRYDGDSQPFVREAFLSQETQILLDWLPTASKAGFYPYQALPPVQQPIGLNTVTFHVTNPCNFRCEHCYHNDYTKADDLDLIEIKRLAVEMAENQASDVILTGGEPFLRPDLIEMVGIFSDHYIASIINTNGSLITKDHLQALKKNRVGLLSISLDGPTAEIHNGIRKNPTSWQKIMALLPLLEEYGIKFGISSMMTQDWLSDLAAIDRLIDTLGPYSMMTRWLLSETSPAGTGFGEAFYQRYKLSPEDSVLLSRYILNTLQRKQPANPGTAYINKIYRWSPGQTSGVMPQGVYDIRSLEDSRNNVLCEEHKDILYMESDGLVPFCTLFKSRFPISIGHLRHEPLSTIWEKLCRLRMEYTIPKRQFCSSCDLLKYCGGGCPGENPAPDAHILTTCDTSSKTILPLIQYEYEALMPKNLTAVVCG